METHFIEAVSESHEGDKRNYGKFLLGKFTEDEWSYVSAVREPSLGIEAMLRAGREALEGDDPDLTDWLIEMGSARLLASCGWFHEHLLVLDLATGEGAIFRHGGYAPADLNKHKVWVCPLFEPFLSWLYQQDVSDLDALPAAVTLTGVPLQLQGYRRPGS